MRCSFTIFLILFFSYVNSQNISFVVDRSIKQTAIGSIDTVSEKKNLSLGSVGVFCTKSKYARYIDDTISADFNKEEIFSGLYYHRHDSTVVVISSENRYETVVLFVIKDSVHAFYEQTNHENARLYSLTKNGLLSDCILVPFKKIVIKLSSAIKKNIQETLYGYVDFETFDYNFDNRLYKLSIKKKYKKKVTGKMYFMLTYSK